MRVLLVGALASTLVLSACQSGGLSRETDIQDRQVQQLRRDLTAARQRAVMAEVEAERLTSKIAELERELTEARARSSAAPAARETGQVIRDLADGGAATSPRATIEEVELEEPEPPPVTRTPPSSTAPPASTSPPSGGDSPQAIYDSAYTLFHEKSYAEAEAAFKRFLTLHPQSHLADNAQFWIGECRWARGDFSSALSAFMATVEGYPHGNKVSDALLKAGRCLEALGQKSRAVVTYEELTTRFPDSVAAISAQQRLGDLRN